MQQHTGVWSAPPSAGLTGQEGESQEAVGKLDAGRRLTWCLGWKRDWLVACDMWNGTDSSL